MNKDLALKIFKTLGEKTRFKIIETLLDKELCACEIPKIINRTQSNTSMHLTKLQDLDMIKSRRDGKKRLYSIKNENIKKIMKMIK
ncbi:MAG: metalloregulator ArsR/SmtB family transcription factor [DPANN group archaeon]|nr:metalloregulator ArsR/SmtB family transcription factor [DPANN group archaeon]